MPRANLSRAAAPDRHAGDGDFALGWIGDRAGRGERRQVVVLVCGLQAPAADGSASPLAATRLDPEEFAELLVGQVRTIARTVAEFGGAIVAGGNDRQIACWGWPVGANDDGCRAVAAALAIVERLGGEARCGLEAGIAVTGPIDGQSVGTTIVGEVMHDAALLHAAAPASSVVMGAGLRELVRDTFAMRALPSRHSVPLFLVETVAARGGRMPGGRLLGAGLLGAGLRDAGLPGAVVVGGGLPGDRAQQVRALFGREREVQVLLDHWRKAIAGTTTSVIVQGEAGVGKSALVAVLEAHVARAGGALIEVQCQRDIEPAPRLPLLELAEAVHDLLCQCEAIGGRHRAGGFAGTADSRDLVSRIAEAISALAPPVSEAGVEGAPRPVLIVVEDLQRADAETRAGLQRLSEQLPAALPVLIVVTSRCGLDRELDGLWRRLRLERLDHEAIEGLLASLPIDAELEPDARARIAALAEGIPFYAVELARMQATAPAGLLDHRILLHPSRLVASITNRLDRLGSLKPLAQVAAVLGRVFDRRLLAAVLQMDPHTLTARLDMLAGQGILTRRKRRTSPQDGADSYRFCHVLVWSVAYGSMLKSRRRGIHARAAEELTSNFTALADYDPAVVAHQFVKAGMPAKAFAWWHSAARHAAENGAAAKAVDFINHALAARTAAPDACSALQEAELMNLLGAQLSLLGEASSSSIHCVYARAMDLVSALPAHGGDLQFDIQWGVTTLHMVRGEFDDAVTVSSRLIDEVRGLGRSDILLPALRLHGSAKLLSGCVGEAIELLRTVDSLYKPEVHCRLRFRYVSDPGAIGIAHLTWATAISGDFIASKAAQHKALVRAGVLDHPHTKAAVLAALATAAQIRGDVTEAATFAHACRTFSLEHDLKYWVVRAAQISSWVAARRDPERGLQEIRAANESYRGTKSSRSLSYGGYLEAEIALAAEQPKACLAALDRAEVVDTAQNGKLYASEFRRLRALALLAIDPAAGEAVDTLLMEAEVLARSQGAGTFADRAAAARAARPDRRPRALPDVVR